MTGQVFVEAIDITEATLDAEGRVLRGVVLIKAGESANKRDYPAEVLQASVPVFEGVKAYSDHPTRTEMKERSERGVRDITGWYSNVRFTGDRLVADRHFTKNQAGQDAWALAEDVVSGVAPKTLAGLSINAVGTARKRDSGGMVVESITYAHSVDDVTTPAAGGSYIESVSGDALTQALVEALDYDEWVSLRPEFTERFDKERRKVRRNATLSKTIAERDQYRARADELQAKVDQLQEAAAEAVRLAEEAQHAVLVERTLAKAVKLPAKWKESLRDEMLKATPEECTAILERDIAKAKAGGMAPKVSVNGASQQVSEQVVVVQQVESTAPRDDEDAVSWGQRVFKR